MASTSQTGEIISDDACPLFLICGWCPGIGVLVAHLSSADVLGRHKQVAAGLSHAIVTLSGGPGSDRTDPAASRLCHGVNMCLNGVIVSRNAFGVLIAWCDVIVVGEPVVDGQRW